MLRLLADSETAIRRSANPRLIVETLLLRWTMLDRIVDLAQVLERGQSVVGGARWRIGRWRVGRWVGWPTRAPSHPERSEGASAPGRDDRPASGPGSGRSPVRGSAPSHRSG